MIFVTYWAETVACRALLITCLSHFNLQMYTLLVSYLIDSFEYSQNKRNKKGKIKQTFRPSVGKKYP